MEKMDTNSGYTINEFGELVRVEQVDKVKNNDSIPQFTPPQTNASEQENISINEFGELVRNSVGDPANNLDIPTFTPPVAVVEPVSIKEVKTLQEEMFPEIYKEKQIEIHKKQSDDTLGKQYEGRIF